MGITILASWEGTKPYDYRIIFSQFSPIEVIFGSEWLIYHWVSYPYIPAVTQDVVKFVKQ